MAELVKSDGLLEFRKACCVCVPLDGVAGTGRKQITIIYGEALCSPPTAALLFEVGWVSI